MDVGARKHHKSDFPQSPMNGPGCIILFYRVGHLVICYDSFLLFLFSLCPCPQNVSKDRKHRAVEEKGLLKG